MVTSSWSNVRSPYRLQYNFSFLMWYHVSYIGRNIRWLWIPWYIFYTRQVIGSPYTNVFCVVVLIYVYITGTYMANTYALLNTNILTHLLRSILRSSFFFTPEQCFYSGATSILTPKHCFIACTYRWYTFVRTWQIYILTTNILTYNKYTYSLTPEHTPEQCFYSGATSIVTPKQCFTACTYRWYMSVRKTTLNDHNR